MSHQSSAIASIIIKLKTCEKKEEFLEAVKAQEDIFYADAEKAVNSTLIPELQSKEITQPNTLQPTFLRTTSTVDPNYITSQDIYTKHLSSIAKPIEHEQLQQRIFAEMSLMNFPLLDKNQLDVNANSKFYHPIKSDFGIHEIPRQFANQTNMQRILINETDHYGISNPEQKFIYPRSNIIDRTIPARPLPDFLNQQEKDFKFQPAINSIGGFRDTIHPITQSLRENEQRLFLNTPEHTFLTAAKNPPVKKPSPPKIEEGIIPDPFVRNPQYRLYNMNVNIQDNQINPESYIPVRQQNQEVIYNEPTKLSAFLDKQKQERLLKQKNFV